MDKDTTKSTYEEYFYEINFESFSKIINVLQIDQDVQKLTLHKFLQLMIYAQFNQSESLTVLTSDLRSMEELQEHIQLSSISTASLSRKLNFTSPEILSKIFQYLVQQITQKMWNSTDLQETTKLRVIDSSTMSMCLSQHRWALFRSTKAGVKLHLRVVVSKDMTVPEKAILTTAKPADRTQMDHLVEVDSDAIYLFDRGYTDYKKYDLFCYKSIRFITRLKDNAIIEVIESKELPEGSQFLKDQIVRIGKPGTTQMENPVRLLETYDGQGNRIVLITNCFDTLAEEIGELYRQRWKIETFFKWMKQHLKIKRFYGMSENAVFNQIFIGLITYCLSTLFHMKMKPHKTLYELQNLIKTTLFKSYTYLLKCVFRTPERKSKGRRKQRWEEEFLTLIEQYEREEVDYLDSLEYDPVFI